jgi:hypothetical protein
VNIFGSRAVFLKSATPISCSGRKRKRIVRQNVYLDELALVLN